MKLNLPDQQYLLSILEYRDGKLYWKIPKCNNRIKKGDSAGSKTSNGYMCLRLDKKTYQLHNIIWKMINGVDPNEQIDHINHDKTDNRIENLREVSSKENCKNKSKQKNNTSGNPNIRILNKGLKKYQVVFKSKNYSKCFLKLEEAIQHRNEKYIEFDFHNNHGS